QGVPHRVHPVRAAGRAARARRPTHRASADPGARGRDALRPRPHVRAGHPCVLPGARRRHRVRPARAAGGPDHLPTEGMGVGVPHGGGLDGRRRAGVRVAVTGDGKDGSFEARLDELRDAAAREGKVDAPGVRAAGGPLPAAGGPLPPSSAPRATRLNGAPGYYGRPVLKPPVWTWEIPVYFFVGGLAGGCAILAWAAQVAAPEAVLVRTALRSEERRGGE